MPSRREFIQAGIAASVVPIAFPIQEPVRAAAKADIAAPSPHGPLRVVCDIRSSYSVDLAHEAERLGLTRSFARAAISRISGSPISRLSGRSRRSRLQD